MRLLLDTHALLWFCEGNPLLSNRARQAMEDDSNERFVSHASAWEIAIKLNLGKLKLQNEFAQIFPGVLLANHFQILLPEFSHYQVLLSLPMHRRDPFDRLLISQALVEKPALITCDSQIAAYGIPIVW